MLAREYCILWQTLFMFRKVNWAHSLTYGIVGAVLFSIAALIFIQRASYTDSWLLYVGSMAFFITMIVGLISYNKKRGGDESSAAMVFQGHITTIVGVLASLLICFLLLTIFVPGYLGAGDTAKQLTDEPANTVHDKTNGLGFKVFVLALLANFIFGSMASIIYPFTAKRNQTGDKKDPAPLHQQGVK